MRQSEYKYFAFISYNSKDTEWGKRVQRKLEHYRMPAALCSERGWVRTPIKPVFFAPTDIQPGPLSEELQDRLRASRHLIVVCSPNSARSEWVGREIEFFHSLGRTKNIHFFIVEGEPHSQYPSRECFNPVVDTLGLPEILGANIHEKVSKWPWGNRERAYVQLISKLLEVEFDAIWQRHRRLMIQKMMAWIVGCLAVLSAVLGVWISSQSIDVKMSLMEISVPNENLPPLKDAVVTVALENEIKSDTIHSLYSSSVINNIPRKFIGKSVGITVRCKDYIDVDTTLVLSEDVLITVQRDPDVYGDIRFDIWNDSGEGVKDVVVVIEGYEVSTDEKGHLQMSIPLEKQNDKYHIRASVPLAKDTIYMPCGENDVIMIK